MSDDTWVENEPLSPLAQTLKELLPTDSPAKLRRSAELILEIFAHDLKLADAVIGRWVYEVLEYMRQSFPQDIAQRREAILAHYAKTMEQMSQEVIDALWPDLTLDFKDV